MGDDALFDEHEVHVGMDLGGREVEVSTEQVAAYIAGTGTVNVRLFSHGAVPSVDPSSTTTTSKRGAPCCASSAWRTSARTSNRLWVGMTTETSGGIGGDRIPYRLRLVPTLRVGTPPCRSAARNADVAVPRQRPETSKIVQANSFRRAAHARPPAERGSERCVPRSV